jgi:hypothetical protein
MLTAHSGFPAAREQSRGISFVELPKSLAHSVEVAVVELTEHVGELRVEAAYYLPAAMGEGATSWPGVRRLPADRRLPRPASPWWRRGT